MQPGIIRNATVHSVIARGVLFLSASALLATASLSPVLARTESNPREGLPGRRVSGGSRQPVAACVAGADQLVALMPETNLALATEALPTLWFHLPDVAPSRQLEFKLYEPSGQSYEAHLSVPSTSGLAGVDLEELAKTTDAPVLEAEQAYRWTFAIVCDPENRSEDYWVQGWVQRVEPGAADGATWSVSVDEFTTQAQSSPQAADLMQQWRDLVQLAGLERAVPTTLAREPITLQPVATEIVLDAVAESEISEIDL